MGRAVLRASLLAAFLGCQSGPPDRGQSPLLSPPTPAPTVVRKVSPPVLASEDPPPDPPYALTLAADCLEQGDRRGAARHLEAHVREHPDQVVFRAQLADLLVRLDRLPEAQAHFEAAAARAQDGPPVLRKELVHYHTRLMEIAQQRSDEYGEHLHRGIGLYLVAARLAERDGDAGDVERLMCKAAAALKEAQACRPDDARPAYYLYRVWSDLDQPRPAARSLRQAVAAAPFSVLTSTEARELALASRPGLSRN